MGEQTQNDGTTAENGRVIEHDHDRIKRQPDIVGIRQATRKGYIECEVGGVADFSYPESKLRRGRVQGGGTDKPYPNSGKFRHL